MNTTKYQSEEIWLPIKNFILYEVSNLGNIRNAKTKKTIKRKNNSFYPSVKMYANGKRHFKNVHRIVAEAFLGPRPHGLVTCHKDCDKNNISVENLRYATQKENIHDTIKAGRLATGTKLPHCKIPNEDLPSIINKEFSIEYYSAKYKVQPRHIIRIQQGKRRVNAK